ncbi:MAG TPA: rod shape-determining protein MreC [Marmoricola sp.]
MGGQKTPLGPRVRVQGDERRGSRRPRLVLLLVLACLTVMTLDAKTGSSSPLEPLRSAVGTVVGPAESVAAAAARPFSDLGSAFSDNRSLRHQVATLTAENSQLRSENALAPQQRSRLAELKALTGTAADTGYTLVAARVIAVGSAQSFQRTVTIDAGTSSGVRADMTVLSGAGLVGRVVSATRSTATVLLIVDRGSVVGTRLGSSLEMGSVTGEDSLRGHGSLQLDLLDSSVTPAKGDVVSTWGSKDGVPYVAGVPIGKVTDVRANPRNLAVHATVEPFADFSALDLVGVVVPSGSTGDRVISADGKTTR